MNGMRRMQSLFALATIGIALAAGGGCKKEEEKKPAEEKKAEPAKAAEAKKEGSAPAKAAPKKDASKKKAPPPDPKHPVPADWEVMQDEVKGFDFKVPKGTPPGKNESHAGIDYFVVQTPEPHKIDIAVAVFKDATLTKDDLAKKSQSMLEGFGDKDVKIDKFEDKGPDYAYAPFTTTIGDGKKSKGVVMVAIDKTDNMFFYVSSEEKDYEKNKDTIEAIANSFSLWSGGASGASGAGGAPAAPPQ